MDNRGVKEQLRASLLSARFARLHFLKAFEKGPELAMAKILHLIWVAVFLQLFIEMGESPVNPPKEHK